jgi:hypothetical protein
MDRLGRLFVLVLRQISEHNWVMKTVRQRSVLVGCVLLAFGVSAFAETGVSQVSREGRRSDQKICYTVIGSSIPQPCDRFAGPIPTTVNPIDIYGKRPRRGHH